MERKIAALLLAAGNSQRMGRSKQLLPVGDQPAVIRCIGTILAAGITDIIVVTGGQYGDEVAAALHSQPVSLVRNSAQESDMAASIRIGLQRVSGDCSGVCVFPVDHPLVSASTCRHLAEQHQDAPDQITIPLHGGKSGHPTLFPRQAIAEIEHLPTLREIIRGDPDRVRFVEVSDPGVLINMDSWEDYERVLRLVARGDPKWW